MTGVQVQQRDEQVVITHTSMGRIAALPLILLVKAYRLVISPMLGPRCKYHPSCSAYALGALETHGAIKGVLLAIARLGRCNPWSLGGLDPVPPRGAWRPSILPDGSPRTGPS
jgi:uncharacterized protein